MSKAKKSSRGVSDTPKPRYRYHPDQAWTCIGCGKCCTMWDIPVTREEKERIEALEIPEFNFEKERFFIPYKRFGGLFMIKKRDEKCVFLGSDGLCVIHKHHGEAVKALACRLYPLHILQWVDGEVSASFRFDCNAVLLNEGRKISEHEGEIFKLLSELRQSDAQSNAKFTSTRLNPQPPLGNMREVAAVYREILLRNDHSLGVRLHYAICLLEFHTSKFGIGHVAKLDDEFRTDALDYMESHADEFEYAIFDAEPSNKIHEMIFNYLLSGFARVDEEVRSKSFLTGRVGRIVPILKFIMSKGSLRTLSREYPDTSGLSAFNALEPAVLDWESHALLERYISVQLSSLHFCGNPGPTLTFEEGVRHLVLAIVVTVSIAAFHSAEESGRLKKTENSKGERLFVNVKHTTAALRIVDHTFYHSPFFGLRHVRRMTKWLISERNLSPILKLLDGPFPET
ncbi:MAG: YkgJ family cysteine cluster protein, partial [Kiritimatiellaeota bacterium]|nr:YkgJ family cysteine cluster protein [Kiritimatiellota bacterium]